MVLVLVMGSSPGNFCDAGASNDCHSICVNRLVAMGATLSNLCASASYVCHSLQFLW